MKGLMLLTLVTIPIFIFYLITIMGFHQVPSPLYGGDYYFHLGHVLHIYNGNAPWTDPQILGEYSHYGWLYHSLVAYSAKLLGTDILKTFLYFPLVVLILSSITSYYLGKRLLKNNYFALLFTFIWIGALTSYNEIHSRPFAVAFLMPLFLLTFIKTEQNKSLNNKIYLGLLLGAIGLTHLMAFASSILFLFAYFAGELLLAFKAKKSIHNVCVKAGEILNNYWKSAVIAAATSMAYIGPLLFHYKLKALNNQPVYSSPIPTAMSFVYFLRDTFFNYTSFLWFAISATSIIGLYSVIKNRHILEYRVVLILMISTIIGGFYYFITIPLGINIMIYWQLIVYTQKLLQLCLILIGIAKIFDLIKPTRYKTTFIAIIIVIFSSVTAQSEMEVYNGRWTKVGRTENPVMYSMADWVRGNTDKNAVFLSTNELSGAIHYLTGRKVVVNRGTHTSQFVDMDQRKVDVAIMLYGNDINETKRLLKQYNVSYVYYDYSWMRTLTWDPFLVFPKNSAILHKYNIPFDWVNKRLDPAKTDVPKYDLLQVKYSNLWSPDFDSLVYPIKIFGEKNNPQYAILAINKTKLN